MRHIPIQASLLTRPWSSRLAARHRLGMGNVAVVLLGLACAFLMTWMPTIPPQALLGVTCLCLLYLGAVNTTAAICLFVLLNPLLFLVRNTMPNDLVLSGARAIWIFCLSVGWSVALLQRRARWPSGPDVTALLCFSAYAVVMTVASASLLDAFLGFRMLVVPIAFYCIVRGVLADKIDAGRYVLLSVAISASMMAVLSICWYNGWIQLGTVFSEGEGYIPGGGRVVLGHYFERMASLIGAGASNGGIYFGAGLVICMALVTVKHVVLWKRALLLILGIVCGVAAFLTLSRSVVVLVLIALPALLLSATTRITAKILFIGVLVVFTVSVVFGTAFTGITLIDVISKYSITWISAFPADLRLIFGGGITSAGGHLAGGAKATILVDAGWPEIWVMMGLPGILAMLVFCWLLARNFYRVAKTRALSAAHYTTAVIAGSVALGLLIASGHIAIIIRPATEMIFYAMAAIVMATYLSSFRQTAPRSIRKFG